MQLSNNEKNPNEKWTKLNGHFSKEDIRVVHGYMKRCSACLTCREMEIKTTVRYQPYLLEWLSSRRYVTGAVW